MFEIPNPKHQNPNKIRNLKSQGSKRRTPACSGADAAECVTGFGILDLVLGICLRFGVWNLVAALPG
jgi:hypothetical protein